jgi:prepilin-type N-terminal cleavage/methylation domain-containing protein
MNLNNSPKQGFTLLELLLVIAIIAILAGLIIFNLNPAQRLQDTNDSRVRSDVESIANAISLYVIDRGGVFASLNIATTQESLGPATSFSRWIVGGGYIQTIPTAPTSYSIYRVNRNTNNTFQVCGRVKTGNTQFCTTR